MATEKVGGDTDVLVLVWVHGWVWHGDAADERFKGNEVTFEDFPNRLLSDVQADGRPGPSSGRDAPFIISAIACFPSVRNSRGAGAFVQLL